MAAPGGCNLQQHWPALTSLHVEESLDLLQTAVVACGYALPVHDQESVAMLTLWSHAATLHCSEFITQSDPPLLLPIPNPTQQPQPQQQKVYPRDHIGFGLPGRFRIQLFDAAGEPLNKEIKNKKELLL
jgi:hypothetical protein